MPLTDSTYKPPIYLRNGHVATILPNLLRHVQGVDYFRERIETPDDDFLDLDWLSRGGNKLVVISHGLEGSTNRQYVKGMAKYFYLQGWDALAWNCRSCSGEMNRQARFYHHGDINDLALVIDYALTKHHYDTIALIGFSMGGSMSLKYLGKYGTTLPGAVKGAVVYSVPVDLSSSVHELAKKPNDFYRKRFLRKLERKIKAKSLKHPEQVPYNGFEEIRYFPDFDNMYTAPLHGFKDASDFYNQGSAVHYLKDIQVPVLIVNALNDPFLPKACYPYSLCSEHSYVHLETPRYGGHVGFSLPGKSMNYMEKRAVEFLQVISHFQ